MELDSADLSAESSSSSSHFFFVFTFTSFFRWKNINSNAFDGSFNSEEDFTSQFNGLYYYGGSKPRTKKA